MLSYILTFLHKLKVLEELWTWNEDLKTTEYEEAES